VQDDFKYWAFISYSHRDEAWARWLHSRLERYRVPRPRVSRASPGESLPRRLEPIFLDRVDLAARSNLSEYLKGCLSVSRNLIVICSPAAAASRWVDEEIRYFKQLGREDRIFCLIVDGEIDDPARECLPAAVRFHVAASGQLTDQPCEPCAADARPKGDGKANAFFKIVAGLLDVDFDDLKQREKRRRFKNRLVAAFATVLIVTVFYLLFASEEETRRQDFLANCREAAVEWEASGKLEPACVYLAAAAARLSPAERETPLWREALLHDSRALIQPAETLRRHTNWVSHVVFEPHDRNLISTGWDGALWLWPLPAPGQPRTLAAAPELQGDMLMCATYNRAGDMIAVGSYWRALWYIADVSGRRVSRVIATHRGRINDIAFNSAGTLVATASDDCTIGLWDAQGNLIRQITGHHAGVKTVCFSTDGDRLLSASLDGTGRIWDVETGAEVARFDLGKDNQMNCAALSPDGQRVATGDFEGHLGVWTAAGKLMFSAAADSKRINSVAFNARGDQLLTSSDDGTAKVWNAADGTLLLSLEAHTGNVHSAAFNADGTLIATAGRDETVRLWRWADAPPPDLGWDDFIRSTRKLPYVLKDGSLYLVSEKGKRLIRPTPGGS
jgi:sugar lactone lactonase YvrE